MIDKKIEELIGYNNTFDFTKRVINNNNGLTFFIYFNPFLIDSLKVSRLMASIIKIKNQINKTNYIEVIQDEFISESISITSNILDVSDAIFGGDFTIVTDFSDKYLFMETKSYPSRGIDEPDLEKVVRGSRDGFTEVMATNIGLIRRRIKNKNLCFKEYIIGKISKTKVILVYLKNVINDKILINIEEKLDNLKVKELTMSDKALEELLLNNTYTPYPLVKYTERPDTFSMHLYQGMFGLIVDTSPSAILGPVSVFDHMQHAEEFRQSVVAGTYLRIIRFITVLISFFIMPLWYALTTNENLPQILTFIKNTESTHAGLFFKLLVVEVGIEVVRMASIHTPSPLSTSMGLIAGIILGELTIKAGIFTEELVILSSISAIGSYITPSYELSVANKMAKLALLVLILLFKWYGLIVGVILLTFYLATLKSFSRGYLYPLIPFNFKDLVKQLSRIPYKIKEKTK